MAMQAPFYTASGESKGQVDLPEIIFGGPGSRRVLQEVVVILQGNQRRGTSSTLTRGNVSGGGRKPWKQKGTGNARSGSNRSPLWRKGGIIFGPHPRSYRIDVPAAKKLLALQTALVEKAKSSELSVMDSIEFNEGKTKPVLDLVKKTGAHRGLLLVVDKKNPMLLRAVRNVPNVCVADAVEVNAWMLLAAKKIIFTKSALDIIVSRFPKG
jgi:large subunit ribosomal protein L4